MAGSDISCEFSSLGWPCWAWCVIAVIAFLVLAGLWDLAFTWKIKRSEAYAVNRELRLRLADERSRSDLWRDALLAVVERQEQSERNRTSSPAVDQDVRNNNWNSTQGTTKRRRRHNLSASEPSSANKSPTMSSPSSTSLPPRNPNPDQKKAWFIANGFPLNEMSGVHVDADGRFKLYAWPHRQPDGEVVWLV